VICLPELDKLYGVIPFDLIIAFNGEVFDGLWPLLGEKTRQREEKQKC
jgi:hypothetical protein